MSFETLISSQELSRHLAETDWVVIDCRFDLAYPDWGIGEYLANHIPTARYAHLNNDLSSKVTFQTGRHPLPEKMKILSKFGNWGISKNSQVVAYDQSDGSIASRLWWLLRYYGHTSVAVLDGGYQKWQEEGLPLNSGHEHKSAVNFHGFPNYKMVADIGLVEHARVDPDWLVIDARAPERYMGTSEPIDPIAGHIPGSVNYYFGNNINTANTYKKPREIKREFNKLLNGRHPGRVIVYCGSGVTSCSILLALEYAGIKGALLYPGSWSEWIRNPDNPIAAVG